MPLAFTVTRGFCVNWVGTQGPGSSLGSRMPGFPSRRLGVSVESPQRPLLAGCVSGNSTPQLLRGKAGRASSCNSRALPPEGDGCAGEGLRLGTTSLLQSLANALWTPRRVFSPPALSPGPYSFPPLQPLHPPRCLLLPRPDRLLLSLLPRRL